MMGYNVSKWKKDSLKYLNKKRKREKYHKPSDKKYLNLGCGDLYFEGWVNLDYDKKKRVDIIWDLNKYPYPFKNNSFDLIYCSHILEHVNDIFRCLKELRRIIKPGGIIHIRVPHFSYGQSYADLTHKRFFGAMTFRQLIKGDFKEDFSDFEIIEEKLNFLSTAYPTINKIFGWFFNNINWIFYERFLCWILPITEVEIKIKVNK